eukprot:COSAG05_NODE_3428_length_2072_cov_3.125697_1_plen_232_part_00
MDLSATLELKPGSGRTFGRSLSRAANRSYRSVSTRPDSQDGSVPKAAAHSSTPSVYKSRFMPRRAGVGQAWATTVSRGLQTEEAIGTTPAVPTPPGNFALDMEVVDFQDVDAAPRVSEKERLRYEHEQSQMELMQFIAQISTGGYGNQFEYLKPMQIDDFPANPYHLKVPRPRQRPHAAAHARLTFGLRYPADRAALGRGRGRFFHFVGQRCHAFSRGASRLHTVGALAAT